MNELLKRATCPKCGKMRIKGRWGSPYAVCPDSHGKLVLLSTRELINATIMQEMPEALRVGKSTFTIAGQEGQFRFLYKGGGLPPEPDEHLPIGCVIAYLYSEIMRVRVYEPVGD